MTGMEALRTAAPYLSQFRDHVFVVKIGGELIDQPAALAGVAEQIALLHALGIRIVVVHGGGAAMDRMCEKLGLSLMKIDGRRVTDEAALDAVTMTLGGSVRLRVVGSLRKAGLQAVGLTGQDAGLVKSRRRPPTETSQGMVDFGFVGDVDEVDLALIHRLLEGRFVPVVAPISATTDGQPLNTNADTVAASLAAALKAEKLIFVGSMPGLLRDAERPETLVPFVAAGELDSWISGGAVHGGMLPKLAAVRAALDGGVASVHLVSGRMPDALLIEVFTNEGSGTMFQPGAPR